MHEACYRIQLMAINLLERVNANSTLIQSTINLQTHQRGNLIHYSNHPQFAPRDPHHLPLGDEVIDTAHGALGQQEQNRNRQQQQRTFHGFEVALVHGKANRAGNLSFPVDTGSGITAIGGRGLSGSGPRGTRRHRG